METKMKVLIAYDGIGSFENKINDLKRAGLPPQVEAVVLTAVDAYQGPIGYAQAPLPGEPIVYVEALRKEVCKRIDKQLEKAKKTAASAAKKLRQSFPSWTVRSEAVVDSPNWAIIRKEDAWKPDLIVMGSHNGSVAARFLLGSVSRSVLVHSNRSVRIVRKHLKSQKSPVRLIVGIDGSRDCTAAVDAVAARTWPEKTAVTLVMVFDAKMASAIAFRRIAMERSKAGKEETGEKACLHRILSPYEKKLKDAGLEVSSVVKDGTPWKILVREAESRRADCVFIGARGLGLVDRFLLGSVSNAVASHAHCSVEVVRK